MRRSMLERRLRELIASDPEPGHCCDEYGSCGGCVLNRLRLLLGMPLDPQGEVYEAHRVK